MYSYPIYFADILFEGKALNRKKHQSIVMFPDKASLHPLAWVPPATRKVGEMFCHTRHPNSGEPVGLCSRTAALTQLGRLHDLGFDLLSGAEIEFTPISKQTGKPFFECDGTTYLSNDIFVKHQETMCNLADDLLRS